MARSRLVMTLPLLLPVFPTVPLKVLEPNADRLALWFTAGGAFGDLFLCEELVELRIEEGFQLPPFGFHFEPPWCPTTALYMASNVAGTTVSILELTRT